MNIVVYAKERGVYANKGNGNCWWWLRTPGKEQNEASSVCSYGSIDECGYEVDFECNAVRPALWIDISQ